jgi:aquaporin Z
MLAACTSVAAGALIIGYLSFVSSRKRAHRGVDIARKYFAEFLGTAVLVFFGVGLATLMFGFGFDGGSVAAGVVATAFAFGLTLMALAYVLGPISGCHVNPAVTLGVLLAKRMSPKDAVGYWVAQFAGGIVGALVLWTIFEQSPTYRTSLQGLGTDGYAKASLTHLNLGGALLVEVILTAVFVFVILGVTSKIANAATAGMVIGLTLTVIHLFGIPLTGTSVNPARSLGPALIVGGTALSQVWVFLLAPLVGGAIAAAVHRVLYAQLEA